ncbi:MAG: hypothetical protein AB8B96_01905 [Lysobacterales bacterium]
MTQFWTFSGINSPRDPSTGLFTDYVWEMVKNTMAGFDPDRRYASQLGTTDAYDRDHNVLRLKAEERLDREAREYADNGGGWPIVASGALNGKTVKVLLVAPKTTTKPPEDSGLTVEVYWSPRDHVPNQSIIRPDSLTYWREFERGGGQVWPVENRTGSGLGQGHDFSGFAVAHPKLVTRVLVPRPGSHVKRYLWRETGETAPSPVARLKSWLSDSSNDLVILAHSQGTNIAMHLLRRGFE